MRELKFRAWTGKKMLYQGKQYLASFIRRIVPEIILDHGSEAFSQHESYLPNGGILDEYLMQFTGLRDKSGKEIYEGDLLEAKDYWGERDYAEVAWNEEQLQWYLKRNGTFYEPLRSPFADGTVVFEVIGNIYEGV